MIATLALAGLALSTPLDFSGPVSVLEARSGCNQGTCPDTKYGIYFFTYENVPGDGKWQYKIRWQGKCGCTDIATDDRGCADMHNCSGHQHVCFDYHNNRADWTDPGGKRRCYSLSSEYVCPASGMWEA